jgi:hypothetical protein
MGLTVSAIIETYTRGRFTVTDDPREVRRTLRIGVEKGLPCVAFTAPSGRTIVVHQDEVRRVRAAQEMRPWARKTAAVLALALVVIPLYIAGTCGMALGGYALLSELFGHGNEILVPGWVFFPGAAAFYMGGLVGVLAADTLGL